MARKPFAGSVRDNLTIYGTGALNVDASRVGGRYPPNVILSHTAECSDTSCAPECPTTPIDTTSDRRPRLHSLPPDSRHFYCPKPSRIEREAGCEHLPEQRLDLFPNSTRKGRTRSGNAHPTVKPIAVMRWLIQLVSPPNGVVLDPFCGSGTTGASAALEHRRFIGIELNHEYIQIAHARIQHWARQRSAGAPPMEVHHGPFDGTRDRT